MSGFRHFIRSFASSPVLRRPLLYTDDSCPPCIAVQMVAKHLNLDIAKKDLNLVGWDHLKPEFLRVNPLHCVPTLVDGALTLWDSHAIMTYLATKYGGSDLYPEDLATRAQIQQFLYFEASILFSRLRFLGEPIFYWKSPVEPQDKIDYVFKGITLLETALENKPYLVNGQLSLADISCVSTIETLKYMVKIPLDKYPNIDAWIKRLKELPYYHLNEECALLFENMYREAIRENQRLSQTQSS